MKMTGTAVLGGTGVKRRINVVKGHLVAAISAIDAYAQEPGELSKRQIIKFIGLAMANADQL
jgi:hypothetical protein